MVCLTVALACTIYHYGQQWTAVSFLGIGPEGGEALSSHHIWTFISSVHPSVCLYICTSVPHLSIDFALQMDGRAE
jgi:hypothetical protein